MKKIDTVLSVAIIFKNEIRCLERCLKSLQPLRDAISMQIVMADTGSNDGSREVAEKYADIVFDFPWINDFSAARNAVLDRCTGAWILNLDADEWMDEDSRTLVAFLRDVNNWNQYGGVAIDLRSYVSEDFSAGYTEFAALRMFRRDLHIRYVGAIHEHWGGDPGQTCLVHALFHHDGYVGFSGLKGKAKRERNMKLLEEELAKNPEDLRTLLQCIDSSLGSEKYIWPAVDGVRKKHPEWKRLGPLIFRSAVTATTDPEKKDAIIREMQELFPDSIFVKLDLAHIATIQLGAEKRFDEAILAAEGYLKTLKAYREKGEGLTELSAGSLITVSPRREMQLRAYLAECYYQEERFQDAVDMLETVNVDDIDAATERVAVYVMLNLHAKRRMDMGEHMLCFWEQVMACKHMDELIGTFRAAAARSFTIAQREAEDTAGSRHSYTIFLPMEGKDEIGNAAALMEETDAEALTQKLLDIKKWDEVPIYAIAHALLHGAEYPLPGRPVTIEEIDTLVGRLNAVENAVPTLAIQMVDKEMDDFKSLLWGRALALAAVRTYHWDAEKDSTPGHGVPLAQAFARIEAKYLPRYYVQEVLTKEAIWTVPFMHRFGWYCVKAFQAKERGDLVAYIALLREGMSAAPEAKNTISYLLDNAEREEKERRAADIPAELRVLADQVRAVLAKYAPDDPAVAALKESGAYQKVAYLIEGIEAPVIGGLKQ